MGVVAQVAELAASVHAGLVWLCQEGPGLAGALEVAGRTGYVTLDMSPGYGYSGIVIAMLAQLNPLGVVAAAVFVAGTLVGADSMSRAVTVPTYIADVIVSVALLAMLAFSSCTTHDSTQTASEHVAADAHHGAQQNPFEFAHHPRTFPPVEFAHQDEGSNELPSFLNSI